MLFRPIIWLSLLATILVTSIDPAFAQIPDNALDDILDQFKQNLPAGRVVKNYAQTLFYSLLLIEFVYTASQLIFSGSDLGAFGKYLMSRVFIMGLAVLIFNSGDLIALIIRNTIDTVATNVGGVEPNPANIIERGVSLSATLADDVSWWNATKAVPILIAGIVMSIIFAMIAANMVVVLAEIYILTVVGAFLLGFMGAAITRDYAIGYFRYTIAVSFKLLIMQVIVGLGFTVMDGWLNGLGAGQITGTGMFALVSTAVVFATLTNTLPNAARDLINGTSSGSFGGVGGAVGQMSSTANSMRQAAGAMSSTAVSMTKTAGSMGMAAQAASKMAKSGGATGAAVMSGAAANIAKATGHEIGKSIRGVNGPVAARQSMAQRVNRNLTKQANK